MKLPSIGKTKKPLAQNICRPLFREPGHPNYFKNCFQLLRIKYVISGNAFIYSMYKLVCEFGVVNLCIIFMVIYMLQNIYGHL